MENFRGSIICHFGQASLRQIGGGGWREVSFSSRKMEHWICISNSSERHLWYSKVKNLIFYVYTGIWERKK